MNKKKSLLENFIQRAKKINGDKYDYSKSICTDVNLNVIIICNIHGKFYQTPGAHIYQKQGCPHCANNQKISIDEFIKRSKLAHPNKNYDYSKFVLINMSTKGIIICPEHGEFLLRPDKHCGKRKQGCSACSKNKKITLEVFIKRSIEKHSDKFCYDKFIINGLYKKGIIICPIHGEFEQTPSGHMSGRGCRKCGCKEVMTLENFIDRARIAHPYDDYDYSKFYFSGARYSGIIICKIHGEFNMCPDRHLNRSCRGCPICYSKKRYLQEYWLDNEIKLPKSKKYREVKIKIGKKKVIADGFDSNTNTIYEFYGDFWHGNLTRFSPEKINVFNKLSFACLYKRTIDRENLIKSAGYNLIIKWETPADGSEEIYQNYIKNTQSD